MKQTAVLFLYEFVQLQLTDEQQAQFEGLFQQALEMEKEQVMNSWLVDGYTDLTDENWKKEFEEYYNETYETKTN